MKANTSPETYMGSHRWSRPFRWRDMRDVAISVELWPLHWWPWFSIDRDDDAFGGASSITLGPLVLKIIYNAHDGPFGKPLPEEPQP